MTDTEGWPGVGWSGVWVRLKANVNMGQTEDDTVQWDIIKHLYGLVNVLCLERWSGFIIFVLEEKIKLSGRQLKSREKNLRWKTSKL